MKNKLLSLLVLITACWYASCSNPSENSPVLEDGVSQQLATFRKEHISNITYKIHFTIPPILDDPILGSADLYFELKENNSSLQIDFTQPREFIEFLSINGKETPVQVEKEHILVDPAYLNKGKNHIKISFHASDLSVNRNEDFLYTLLVPDRARTLFPCFDQPNLKAVFSLSLTIPSNWNALANGSIRDSTILAGNTQKTYVFNDSDTISTYLFSFAAGKFSVLNKVVNNRNMTFLHRETDTAKVSLSIDTIFDLHSQSLDFLEAYTQIPYPFSKFDFVAIPDFQYGGMEHVGAIQYRAATLFLDQSSTVNQRRSRAKLIAHETAHMWFGNLVTMDWFNDVWMKEVFANFIADKILKDNSTDRRAKLKFLVDHMPAAYNVDRTQGNHPIRQQLPNLQDAGSLYGDIIYHKSPIMMLQLEKLMGEEEFRSGIQKYLRTYYNRNASWPDLIRILDQLTPEDLHTWNQVWVNKGGRPVFRYEADYNGNKINKFTIKQKAEYGGSDLWPQYFEIAFIYNDRTETIPVEMKDREISLTAALGKEKPVCILFNSSGEGYGVFPIDNNALHGQQHITDPVSRASFFINLYENMLNGQHISPYSLLQAYLQLLPTEEDELIIRTVTGQIQSIFWNFLSEQKRKEIAVGLEDTLWNSMEAHSVPSIKKTLYNAYIHVSLTSNAQNRLYASWLNETPPTGINLSEDDYSNLAAQLLVRRHPSTVDIYQAQLKRIQNPDRKKRWIFLSSALTADSTQRDRFFESLKHLKNREKESWVISSLQYLHHPLRVKTSEKYLKQSLDLLEEIQKTGDIFFPAGWLSASLGSYQSKSAKAVVDTFLREHENFNAQLRAKILQASDNLFRAQYLVNTLED